MKVEVIKAELADASSLTQSKAAAFHALYLLYEDSENPCFQTVAYLEEKIEDPLHAVFNILLDGVHVGGIECTVYSEEHYFIDALYVSPCYQARGIAPQAVKQLEHILPQLKMLSLESPHGLDRNTRCYIKLGFTLTETRKRINDKLTLMLFEHIIRR